MPRAITANAQLAAATHRAAATSTTYAARDRVTGTVKLRLVVDAEGLPRRIVITQPLGYGLDARAVEAAGKYRFTPAIVNGAPAASNVQMNQDFVVVQAPH